MTNVSLTATGMTANMICTGQDDDDGNRTGDIR